MTDNIIASISEFIGPEIINKLATASGLDRSLAGQAVSAAVPTILGSLADLVAKPGGARKLMTAVAEHTGDRETMLSNALGPAQAAAAGNSVLSSMLGGSAPNLLASSIAGMLGVSSTAMQTILGMVTPLILGGLSRLQRARGLDADGLARMLVDQKSNIADAIPAGLSSYFRDSDISGGLGNPRSLPRPEVMRSPSPATTKARRDADAARGVSWPHWALGIAALGALLWALLPSSEHTGSEATAVTEKPIERSSLLPTTRGSIAYIARPEQSWRSIGSSRNDYVNRVIYNVRGEALGNVQDVMVDKDGKPAVAIISVGRYLGFGDKIVAVPFSAVRMEQREGDSRVIIDLVKEALQSAPQYEGAPAPKQ